MPIARAARGTKPQVARRGYSGAAMNVRVLLSITNLVAIVVAFVSLVEFPQYSPYVFLALLAWICVGFAWMYVGRGARTGPGGAPVGTSSPFGGPPLPSSTGPAGGPAPAPIDFCIYCGTTLPAGITVCPACGHHVATF